MYLSQTWGGVSCEDVVKNSSDDQSNDSDGSGTICPKMCLFVGLFAGSITNELKDLTSLKESMCKTKYKMSPSSARSKGGEAAAGYCLNSVSYRVDEAVKYNVLNSD